MEDQLSDSAESEGQPHIEVLGRRDEQLPASMQQTNQGAATGNIQAGTVNISKGKDRLKAIAAWTTANLESTCPHGYIRTRSFYRALGVVKKRGTCILTGSSGSGKTTLARHLLLAFKDEGFLPLELIRPNDCKQIPWNKVGERFRLVLLVDNVLGAGSYEDDLSRKWGIQLDHMRPFIDDGHVKVILASRANIYAQVRDVKGSRELLQEAPEVAVGGGDCQLTDGEKTRILERVLASHKVKLPAQISTKHFIRASNKTANLGYPQMCVYLATNKNALSEPIKFVQNPVQFLNDEFSQHQLNDLKSYFVLILVFLKEGNLAESFLKDASNKAFMSQVAKMVELSPAPDFGQIQKMAKHLCESYLEYNSQCKSFSFSHDSIWDSLFTHLCQSDFDKAVQACTWKQLVLYVRTDPKCKNKEDFVYLVPEGDWPILAKRLLQELTCGDADQACSHPCLQHPDFVRWLLEEFLTEEHIGSLLKSTVKKTDVVTWRQTIDKEVKTLFSLSHLLESSPSSYTVNIFSYQFPTVSLLRRRCPSLAKHILKSAQFEALALSTQSQMLTEALACALYVSDSGLVDWLLARGAKVTEECVKACCCAEQENAGLVEGTLQWDHILSTELLTEMARVASQMDRPRTLELVLTHLPKSESTQAELDSIMAELILLTHPRTLSRKNLSHIAHMLSTLKKAGAQFRSHVDRFTAAGHFDPSALSEWLEQKMDLSATDEDGNTLLHHAAQNGAFSNVQALLSCMDSVSQRDQLVNAEQTLHYRGMNTRDTALHLAAANGHLAVVDILLKNGGDANLTNIRNETALWKLASCEEWNMEGCTSPSEVRGASSSSLSSDSRGLQIAKSDNGVKEILRTLVLNTAAVSHGRRHDVLHQASQNGHTLLVEVLVENGADVNLRDDADKTPVHHAAERGHVDALQVLSANRAQLGARDDKGHTALHLAAEQEHLAVVEMLIKNKMNVDNQDFFMTTPLHVASERGHVQVVKCLLDNEASVNVANTDGQQPLHLAADGGHFPVVECLLDKGACANAQNTGGSTPLHLACGKGHTSTVELLLTHSACVNAQDASGMTPMHLTLKNGDWETAELLIHNGADKE